MESGFFTNEPNVICLWSTCLNVWKERDDWIPVWVRLLGLMIECWTKEVFKEIGNRIDIFISANMPFEQNDDNSTSGYYNLDILPISLLNNNEFCYGFPSSSLFCC